MRKVLIVWNMSLYLEFKTHHYNILFDRPVHSKSGMESYWWSSTDHLSWYAYGIKISQVTELLIMRDPHYGRMCFKSVKRSSTFLAVEKATAFGLGLFHS